MKCKTCNGKGFSTPEKMENSKMCEDCKGSGEAKEDSNHKNKEE